MEPQTTHVPLKNEQYWRPSLGRQRVLIYRRPKLLTVEWSRRADVSQESHCNKMNCHCFLAELYKLPHQSSNMGPPPPAINQRERHVRHKMSQHFPGLQSASGWQVFSCFPAKGRKTKQESSLRTRQKSTSGESLDSCRLENNFTSIIWAEGLWLSHVWHVVNRIFDCADRTGAYRHFQCFSS